MVVLKSTEYLFNVCDITRITCFVSILFALTLASSKLLTLELNKILRNGKQHSSKFFVLFRKKK